MIEAGGPRRLRPLMVALALPLMPVVVLAGASLARAHAATPKPAAVVSAPMPAARSGAATAYDPVHRQVVLFGGRTPDGKEFDDTWTWDGAQWHRRDTPVGGAPPARDAAAMAWDPQLRRIVLFGGSLGMAGSVEDTWTWDGSRWQRQDWWGAQPQVSAPSLVWDATHRELVLVATLGAAPVTATWVLRGGEWAPQPVSGPEWQTGTTVVVGWDAGQRRVAMVATGHVGMACTSAGIAAEPVGRQAPPSPLPVSPGHVLTPVPGVPPLPDLCGPPGGPRCVTQGVAETSEQIQLAPSSVPPTPALPACPPPANAWWWDGAAWRATGQESIPGVDIAVVVPDPLGRRLLVLSGQALWTPQDDHWTVASRAPLSDRVGTAFALDTTHHTLVAFGGFLPDDDRVAGDTWTWNGHTWGHVAG